MAPDPSNPIPDPASPAVDPNPHDLGHKTTEFYVSLLMLLLGTWLTVAPPRPGLDQIGAILIAVAGGGYTVSRGIAKKAAVFFLVLGCSFALVACEVPHDTPPLVDHSGGTVLKHDADSIVIGCQCERCRHFVQECGNCQRFMQVGGESRPTLVTGGNAIDYSTASIADMKTCGCSVDASCGDCCGPKHCRCAPTR